jgi:hypothetical protein
MGKGKSAQHDCIDHSELSGRAAYAEAEYKHSQKTKKFVFEQNTKPDSDILEK